MKVKGKVIVVTGGGSGIGRELVLGLISRGAKVAAVDMHEDTLKETEALLPPEKRSDFSSHILNITDRNAVEMLPQKVIERHGALDGVINNAGIIQPFVKINDLDYESIERVMNVDFYGPLYMIKAFLPHLLKRPVAHIVNVSSMGGFLPVPGQSIYGAAKAGIKLMSEGLSSELDGTPVRVTVIFPGAVNTNIAANSGLGVSMPEASAEEAEEQEKYKPLAPEIAARTILDGMEKDKVRVFVGKDSRMMNMLYRMSPGYATRLITKQMKSLLK